MPSLEQVPGQSSPELIAAREAARSKVYNLRYLIPERCWGPFLPAGSNWKEQESIKDHIGFPEFVEELSRGILGVGDALDNNGQSVHVVADNAEEEFTSQLLTQGEEADEDEYMPNDAEESDEEYDEDDIRLILTNGQQRDPKFIPPKPHQVVPDYAFLSAARLLVEMDLREVLVLDSPPLEGPQEWNFEMNKIVDAFGWLQFVRMGGAPGFWESWMRVEEARLDAEEGIHGSASFVSDINEVPPDTGKGKGKAKDLGQSKGKGKAKETEEYQGWDWAGAAGEWK
jgi:hypothetical protein